MELNKGSIGGLIGVRVIIIVKWDYQDNFKPVYFFMKRFHVRKKH